MNQSKNFIFQQQEGNELLKIYKLLIRNFKLFIGSLIFFIGFAYLVNHYSVPIYEVSTSILIKDDTKQGMGSAEPPRKLTLDGGEVLIDGLRQGRILDVVRARPELHERIWVLAWQRSKAGRLGGIYSEASPAEATAAPHPPAAGSPFNQSLPPDVSETCVR